MLTDFFYKLKEGGVPVSLKEFLTLHEALHSKDQHKIVPPLHGALLKNEQDVHLFERLVFMSRRGRA